MRVAVFLKRVPIPGARIVVTDDGQAVQTAHLGFTMSPHEECAVEQAVRLVDQHGGEAVAFTLGPPEAEEQLRYAVSVGLQGAVLVPTDGRDVDPQTTAAALTAALRAVEAEHGVFDLLLFGNESADSGGYQVGIRVAHALGRPIVNGAKELVVEGDTAVVGRPTGDATERYELPLPAAVGVREGLNLPRYPTFRGRLVSKKVAVQTHGVMGAVDDAAGQRMLTLVPTAEQVTETVILGHGPEAAPRVIAVLEELGVLR
ncbi:electron transfer flavoprotein subunit beta/FixA family protein [soil metagenome]